jgi:hypothetical protein
MTPANDWGPAKVAAAHARYDWLAECLAEMLGWPLKTPKGEYTPRITTEVIRTLFGFGQYTIADIEAWYQDDPGVDHS